MSLHHITQRLWSHLPKSDKLLQEKIGTLSLAGAGLPRDNDALLLFLVQHVVVGVVCHGEDVGRVLTLHHPSVLTRLLPGEEGRKTVLDDIKKWRKSMLAVCKAEKIG